MQPWHQILRKGSSQETESEVHGMQGEIKLFVDPDLQKVLKVLQMDFLG
jgi:hypothetical protein